MRFIKREGSIDEEKVKRSCSEFGLEPAFARLLVGRGIADIRAFLHPKKDDLHDPFLFKNMQISCDRIKKAIKNHEKIAVYADYDADGICSASILCSALRENGALVSPYIPDRKTEGYGTNPDAIRKICEKGFSLIISVDCGIRSVDDVALAKSFGTDFIILDHHETGDLPDTPYIIDPKAEDEVYPCRELCGAGVVFKTVSALFGEKMMKYIDLAGIATIGDIVSLTGENRVIASLGIEKLKYDPNPGIEALCRAAGIEMEKIASRQVSFGIVPRLNAAGRLSHAKFALELILTNDRDKREKLALWLNNLNAERQSKQTDIFTEAAAQVSCVSLADTLAADREGEIFLVPVNGVLEGMMEGSFLDGLLQPEEEAVPSGTGTDLAQGSKSILAYLEKAGELLLSNETIARFKNAIVDKISAMLEEVSAAAVAAISG